ncbi:hypothetical protein CONPUDRAFT_62609 [Coniophora puteana RWD-64-598 SS2]|uniref:Uncharacterized protein n=1 Tax=Coniophora puteana (strain RWD-64-598) TaxID=741705 RepID=A0A5M3MDF7_CONPW|nr:uncharacterized protein CONPUDRAFT_62609 [Coniophora puteana RWD-64-598 SS2]EIW77258.1 hypothetical protein CONPUDRAFT_62609 [Coniophora puteana RWD-64-598 SS2]
MTKASFSVPGVTKPNHFVYDTACEAKQQVMKSNDEWWRTIGMSVDVWHLRNKHKTTHDFCQRYCNPAAFPELKLDDGTGWWFNTSIAEQTNVWLGGYHSMVREMLPIRYNFFLDEMVRIRNINTIATLKAKDLNPQYTPFNFGNIAQAFT